ncbi:hypothetical protein F5883DRAFT_582763 [Diaporthe sp. PMI_573]|nr:hypothetical protein F5883DRAFT_582763 [Diaporthaceae sp. PMI_573]
MPPKRRGAKRRTAPARPQGVAPKPRGRKPKAKAKQTKKEEPCEQPDQSRATPLIFEDYLTVDPGSVRECSRTVLVINPEISSEEQERVEEAKALILQARRAQVKGSVLELLGKDARAWQSVELTANEYNGLVYDAAKSWWLRHSLSGLRLDWMFSPGGRGDGVLTVRNPGSFERRLARAVDAELTSRLNNNRLIHDLGAYWEPLEPLLHARAVATGGGAGLRSPSRTYHHDKKVDKKRDAEDDIWVAHFALELDPEPEPGDRAARLPDVIDSLLNAGTLCVMVVRIERRGLHDFSLPCWLYRRAADGEVSCVPADGEEGLTLFDFVPADVLHEQGVTGPSHERASLESGDIQAEIEKEVFGKPVDGQLERVNNETW